MILAIDPGTTESGWVRFDGRRVVACGIDRNETILAMLESFEPQTFGGCSLAIEMIASYGMPVGREVFETCVWIGRFVQAWHNRDAVRFVYRQDVKVYLCGTPRAKDPNIRAALIDALGEPGTKKKPGPTYGVKSHAWAALAVAVTAMHQLGRRVQTRQAVMFRTESANDSSHEVPA